MINRLLDPQSPTSLRKAALAVVVASQRESGLWALPTSDHERTLLHSAGDSVETAARGEDPFGSDSISLSWLALSSLKAQLGYVPHRILGDVLAGIARLRSSNGSYGRRGPGWKALSEVNESARHTAMAILTLIQFSTIGMPLRIAECVESARYLLLKALNAGGWAYLEAHREKGSEPITTAAAMAALALVQQHHSSNFTFEENKQIKRTLSKAWTLMRKTYLKGSWPFQHPDTLTQFADGMQVFEFLILAFQSKNRRSDERLMSLRALLTDALSLCADGGMPTQAARKDIALNATLGTISTLSVLEEKDAHINDLIALMRRRVISRIDHRAWTHMAFSDWANLCRAMPISSPESDRDLELVRHIEDVRYQAFSGNLTKTELVEVPKVARTAILYALNRGHPYQVPSGHWEARYLRLPNFARATVAALPGLALAEGVDHFTWLWNFVRSLVGW